MFAAPNVLSFIINSKMNFLIQKLWNWRSLTGSCEEWNEILKCLLDSSICSSLCIHSSGLITFVTQTQLICFSCSWNLNNVRQWTLKHRQKLFHSSYRSDFMHFPNFRFTRSSSRCLFHTSMSKYFYAKLVTALLVKTHKTSKSSCMHE